MSWRRLLVGLGLADRGTFEAGGFTGGFEEERFVGHSLGQPQAPGLHVSSLLLVLYLMGSQKVLPYSGYDRTTLLVRALKFPDLLLATLASA